MSAFLLALMLQFCDESGTQTTTHHANDESIVALSKEGFGFTFYTDSKLFRETNNIRTTTVASEKFEITNIARKDSTLYITVSYSATCEDANFDIVWDGIVTLSYPQTINLFLKLSAKNCSLSGDKKESSLEIDLAEFIGDNALSSETVFRVLNASSSQSGECSGTTSSIK